MKKIICLFFAWILGLKTESMTFAMDENSNAILLTDKENEIERHYWAGRQKVDRSIEEGRKFMIEAYFDIKKGANLGDVRCLYYLGYLHEVAAYNGFSFDKNMCKLKHLQEAANYYGFGLQYDDLRDEAENAVSRVMVEAIKATSGEKASNKKILNINTFK